MTDTTQGELKRLQKEEEKTAKPGEATAAEPAPAPEAAKKPEEKAKEAKTETKGKKAAKKEEEKPLEEKIIVIPLRAARRAPRSCRTADAAKRLRERAVKDFKKQRVIISVDLNSLLWTRGIERPPSRVKVKASVFKDRVILSQPEQPARTAAK